MKITERTPAYLLLEDGVLIEGKAIGQRGTTGGEICFNTGMTGYQEIYTDPSYFGQIIVNTTPHIGNYGALDLEQESVHPQIKGIVVNAYSQMHSRSTATSTLQSYLEDHKVVGISDVDTRMLVRHIRNKGAMNALISSVITDPDELKKELSQVPSMEGLELASSVTTSKSYILGEGRKYKIAVVDLGIKKSILRNLTDRNCCCKVFPAQATFEEMQEWDPDGYFISNGPGDPAVMGYGVEAVQKMLNKGKPVFGICLGHQMLARACGIDTYKMHHGHRGLNHPVKNLKTGKCEVTSQNHGFAISEKDVSTSDTVNATHINLNDDTIEGIEVKGNPAFSVQYHPEASPGPHDSRYLFDHFLSFIK